MAIAKKNIIVLLCVSCLPLLVSAQENNQAPAGYTPIFNGKDLSGWYGLKQMNPRDLAKMTGDDRERMRNENFADIKAHWTVDDGELVNDGEGIYLATERDYRDYDLWIDYKTVPKADSGIYLRGNPQVQIWDYTEAGGKWNIGAGRGSGGLWNNSEGSPGKDPSMLADNPFGEWNRFRIMQVGSRTTVWLNGRKIVNHAVMENYNGFGGRGIPHVRKGPIQLQTHGGEIRWQNIFIREIGSDEANEILANHGADEGFKTVFNGRDFTGWKGPTDNYEINDGVLKCKAGKGGTIYTAEEYADFVARLEFKLPPGGNNGLAIRYPGNGDTAYGGMCELQVLDTEHENFRGKIDPRQAHGSAYGMVAAARGYLRPAGEWNFQEVTVSGPKIRVELNGSIILDTDLSKVTEFMGGHAHPGKDRTAGHFGFAGHNDPVGFRNVRIKSLSKKIAKVERAELGSTPNVHCVGAVYLAGQPNESDIVKLKEAGIAKVLDLRTEGEIDWDEPAAIRRSGLDYERLPLRGPATFTDEALGAARQAFASASEGQKLICHCGSANRVGAVWLAYRVLDEGIDWDRALSEAREVGLRTPGYVERIRAYVASQSN